ncbi:beta-lactamase/transpeptidase-like protein [Phaeosphaeria sp. MPI-PUGE-AT-0046c]|nr:beta-lactamase/transpeptidase-like protein [Phaeosphaeria sp. MPI-PUGE-AT-0046c]
MVLPRTFIFASVASAACYEASIAHPLPNLQPNDAVLKHAYAKINAALIAAIIAPEFASTSFSIEITSQKETLWSQHHTARERNVSRPDIPEVNGDALYRIASITKTFTVLGILYQHEAGNLSLDDPIDKYLEELKEEQEGTVPWKDITLRSLASQLSGIPRECTQMFSKCHTEKGMLADLLSMSQEGLPDCDEYSPNYEKPCTARDLFNVVKSKRPLFAPNMKSTYSNVAFELLGLVLERVTNKTYEEYIHEAIFKPLDMSKSTITTPPDNAGVIPLEPHYWGVDEGVQNPTGGIYASTNDLSNYLRYVLTHYNSIATGVNWVHPVSPSEGLYSFYGMPWEILHTDRVLNGSRRTVRFITKGGGLPGYFSIIMTVPDFGLGITILVAGHEGFLQKAIDAVSQTMVRAAEDVAIRQLRERYVGTYTSTNHTLNSSISLVADERGLVIERFISNGTDVLKNVFRSSTRPFYAQLTPTLLFKDEKKQRGEIWRMVQSDVRIEGEGSIWDDFCVANIDTVLYAGVGLNELVFWGAANNGQFEKVELSAFRINMTRMEGLSWHGAQEILEL